MRQAHQAVRQAATELGLAESALQHPSELGLRHTFTTLAMGKRLETVRSVSARAKAQSASAQTLMNHDMHMPESRDMTLLTGMLAVSLAEPHAGTFCTTVPHVCLIQILLCLYNMSSKTLSDQIAHEIAHITFMLLACGSAV